jgi:hypothetical protein
VNATVQHEQERLLKQMEGSWQFGTLPPNVGSAERLLHEAVLRVVGPMIAQQRDFNAALVKFFYTLQDRQDVEVFLNAVMAQLTATEREVSVLRMDLHTRIDILSTEAHARIDAVAAFTGELSARLDVLQRDLHGRLDTTADVLETIRRDANGRLDTTADVLETIRRDANGRLDTLADFDGVLNDRLTRLAYATQLLDQAVVAGDDLDAVLAEALATLAHHDQRSAEAPPTDDGHDAPGLVSQNATGPTGTTTSLSSSSTHPGTGDSPSEGAST